MSKAYVEKRKSPRKRVYGEAVAIIPSGRAACAVQDLSATGAKLSISSRVDLPDEFEVHLLKAKTMRRVVLRWRRGVIAGVEFIKGPLAEP